MKEPVSPSVEYSGDIPVTVVYTRLVRPGREAEFEEWLHELSREALKFDGHLGYNVIRPQSKTKPEYTIISKFDKAEHLQKWVDSDVRARMMDKARPLVQGELKTQVLTGLEAWFTLPGQLMEKALLNPPPRYKIAITSWFGVVVVGNIALLLIEVLPVVGPGFNALPRVVRSMIQVGITTSTMTYAFMPLLTKALYKWLYPVARD